MSRMARGAVLVLVLLAVCALRSAAATKSGPHLPKSRKDVMHEQQEREHRAKMLRKQALREALAEQEAEEQRIKDAADRARKWREDRLRQYQVHQEQQKVIDAAEAERQAELQKEAEAQEQKKADHRERIQRQLEREREAFEKNGRRPLSPAMFSGRGSLGKPLDCFGIPGGPARKDACGVCGGDNSTCSDCKGVPHGKAKEDCAGACGGDDLSCVDCAGVFNGVSEVDQCGVCGGDGTSCLDCLGMPHGTAEPDACGICDGDGSSCSDCHGVPNGLSKMGPCGVCDGDGTSCCSPARSKDEVLRSAITMRDSDRTVVIDRGLVERAQRMAEGAEPAAPPTLCSAHGTCSSEHHFCMCDRGWTGPFCSVRQNLCLQHQADDPEANDACNGRGACDPETGLCACHETESWVGPRCEFSRCNRRGAYSIQTGRCKCQHGYGGQYCERCADHRPKSGFLHVCIEKVGGWQNVPEHLKLDRSILLGEENPKAPVFFLIDAEEERAKSYVADISFMNWAPSPKGKGHKAVHRDIIWPNSTHEASGYYYDCGCRLSAPPSDDADENARGVSPALPYRPQFGPKPQKIDRRSAEQARKERGNAERAPATLSQCQDLLEDVLTEFGFSIDASTADVTELAAAVDQVSSSCAGEATFGIAWFLIAMLVAITIALLTVLCWWCTKRYITIRTPFEEL